MVQSLKRNKHLSFFKNINTDSVKYQAPMILKMYGALNKMNLRNENRYILCNFIDQNSDIMDFKEDIYITNNSKTLNQLFLLAIHKAKEFQLLNALYDEYHTCIDAISQKFEFSQEY